MSDRINMSVRITARPDFIPDLPLMLRKRGAQVFTMGCTRIAVCNEPDGWHLSISCRDRDPSWAEIVTARYRFLPDVGEMAMYLPPLREYTNIQKYTFHLWENKRSRIITV